MRTCRKLYLMMIRPMVIYERYCIKPYVNHFGDTRMHVRVRLWCGCVDEAKKFLRDLGKTYKRVLLMSGGELWEDCVKKHKRGPNPCVDGLILDGPIPDCYNPAYVTELVVETMDQKLIADAINYPKIRTVVCYPHIRLVQPNAHGQFHMSIAQYRQVITNRSILGATVSIDGIRSGGKPAKIKCTQISVNETDLDAMSDMAPQNYRRTCIAYTGDTGVYLKFIKGMRMQCDVLFLSASIKSVMLSFTYE